MDFHSPYFFGYVLGLIHLLGIIAALHAVFTVRTAQGAIAWAMSLFFIPYFTLIPYGVWGPLLLCLHPSQTPGQSGNARRHGQSQLAALG